MKKILVVIGTRPEAIKLGLLSKVLRAEPWVETTVVATAQHRELLDSTLASFGLSPDYDLDLMSPNQSLNSLASRLFIELDAIYVKVRPDLVVVQGDTTSAFIGGMSSFHRQIPVAHVEAGLRTGSLTSPFPEEANRVLLARIASIHFAPTDRAVQSLIGEGVNSSQVHLTGNTGIDSLLYFAGTKPNIGLNPNRQVLITCHRRENFGEALGEICLAIRRLSQEFSGHSFVFSMHPNPNVQTRIRLELAGISNVELRDAIDYQSFVQTMSDSCLIMTDSGGIQEEAPSLGIPVLVMRNDTERQEALEQGSAMLVGTKSDDIFSAATRILTDDQTYKARTKGPSPYGDGSAVPRIVKILREFLS